MIVEGSNIPHAFKIQVSKSTDKIAVYHKDITLTYNELDYISNKVAAYLIKKKLSGNHIGISLHRSPEILISILGVLKAGCTYVFMDPAYPIDRMRYILENANIKLFLTSKEVKKNLSGTRENVIYMNKLLQQSFDEKMPDIPIDPESPAYIMYTSATTGKPKGVVISHGNVLSYIKAVSELYDIEQNDIYLHTASYSFSSSVRQYLVPLLNGIPLYLATEQDVVSLKRTLEIIRKKRITIADSTPSLWKSGLIQIERLSHYEKDLLFNSALRLIVFSGDKLPASLVQQIKKEIKKPFRIINVCGMTEALGAMAYSLPDDFSQNTGNVPVGYPLSNTTMVVLDETMSPVGDGDEGEMIISSPSIGAGYYNNPDLTAQTFIPNTISGDVNRTMLKTGDIVRYWKEKPIELVGRKDFQIKIRGVRIDVNEIESILCEYPGVEDCCVTNIYGSLEELILVAFVVSEGRETISVERMKEFLRTKLPANFIPEMISQIENIPLTPNRKVDRKALQVFAGERYYNKVNIATETEFENEIQKSLYNLFTSILGTNDIKINDNFFDVGGHSLKA
jgi:amino acid adenylation domain-containing protein